jgi:heparosan-N-sulfate-glucuronate 5-epimerase
VLLQRHAREDELDRGDPRRLAGALHPSSQTYYVAPVTILLYGIGYLDRYFLEGNDAFLKPIYHVAAWLLKHKEPENYWKAGPDEMFPSEDFYSSNSALNQGLALSFIVRVLRHRLLEPEMLRPLEALLPLVAANMIQPSDAGGTALRQGNDLYFQEFTTKDGDVILNGWIYAVFGLMDYVSFADDPPVKAALEETLQTMSRTLPKFQLSDGWSYYDSNRRICSPFYHPVHISLVDAMHRLTGDPAYLKYLKAAQKADTRAKRVKYMLIKIKDKLTDKIAHVSQE